MMKAFGLSMVEQTQTIPSEMVPPITRTLRTITGYHSQSTHMSLIGMGSHTYNLAPYFWLICIPSGKKNVAMRTIRDCTG